MLTTATKNKINTARDILVGKIPMPTSQVEQITLALVYKFMSDMDKKARELGDTSGFFANGYEKYSWDKLMDKSLPARDRVKLYGEGLEKMALNPHIPQLFRDIFRNAFLPFNDPETLKLFLDTIDQFEYDHSEELGNAFEYLLQVMGSQGDAGQFRTPRHIIDFIVEVVDPSKNDRILDPACGTAGFLISAYKHIKSKGLTNDEMKTISNNFVGYDISQDMQRLSLVNLYLHHFPDPHIYEYDTLTSEDRWNDDFDVVLANPPFMTPKGGIRPHNRFSVPSNRAEVLFVDYIMEHLTVNGKAGVIVPEGIIFQSQNAYQKLRKMMVDDDFLWAVVSLPSGVFQPYSGVKTSILLFDRQLAKKTNKVLFIRANNDGYNLGAQRKEIKADDLPEALDILKRYKQGLMDGKEINLESTAMAHVVEKKKIREGGYNLSAERYFVADSTKNSNFNPIKLEKLFTIIRNGKNVEQLDGKGMYRVTRIKTIANKVLNLDETKWTNDKVDESYFLRDGDILLSHINSYEHLAKTAIVEKLSEKVVHGTNLILLRPDEKTVSPNFISYILKSAQFIGRARSFAQKAVNQASIKVSDIKNIEIPLPPLSTQLEIVEELDRYQKIIDGAMQISINYQPSFEIKDEWEWKKLGDLASIQSGGTPSKSNPDYWVGDIPWISPKDMKVVRIGDSEDHVNQDAIKSSSTRLVPAGTVLCVVRSSILKHSLPVAITTTDVTFNQDIQAIQVDHKNLLPEFLLYFLIQSEKKILNDAIKPGVTVQSFHSGYFNNLNIPVPPLHAQQEIIDSLEEEYLLMGKIKNLVTETELKITSKIDSLWG